MNKTLHIWPEELQLVGDYVQSSATLEFPNAERQVLWYRLPIAYRDYLTDSCDAFITAAIFLAMRRGTALRLHGHASPSLLSNLEEFQAVWSSWRPSIYRQVDIAADREKEQDQGPDSEGAISTFSGGVDSCFTAHRHAEGTCGRRKRDLRAGLMVHGFDIPVREAAVFENAFSSSQKITSSIGLDLIPVATNFREIITLNWEDIFGSALASCLHLLASRFSIALIPSSYTYRTTTFPYGSNAITDPLLSSDALRILYDGAVLNRFEKIRQLKEWPEFSQYLRVCWQCEQKDRNCCRCEKCTRNILIFRALGCGLPPCFPEDVSNEQIAGLRVKGGSLDALKSMSKAVKAQGNKAPWVRALDRSIRRNELRNVFDRFF